MTSLLQSLNPIIYPRRLLESLVLPELRDWVSNVLDKDADSLPEVVLKVAEHGLG